MNLSKLTLGAFFDFYRPARKFVTFKIRYTSSRLSIYKGL